MSEYRLSDLLDMSFVQKLADSNFKATGLQMSIVDAFDGSFLVRSGWPGICTHFHRVNERSLKQCRISDNVIADHLDEEVYRYRCNNGIWHIAMPIVVAGRHIGTLFLTQFWFDDEVIDREYFINQARQYGFDQESYLKSLDGMPVFSRAKVEYIVAYDRALVRFISDLAEQTIRFIETQNSLSESENKYRTLIDNIPIGVYRNIPAGEGSFVKVNPAMVKMFGYASSEEFMESMASDLYPDFESRKKVLDMIRDRGFIKDLELLMKQKNGAPIWCSLTATAQLDKNGDILWLDGVIEDITDRRIAQKALQEAHDLLETRVQERTNELAETNRLLLFEIAERKRFEEKLREISEIDHLTNVYNRRKLSEIMELEVEKSRRYSRPLSLIMLDIDHFKRINDTFGHNVGDDVIRETARLIGGLIRRVDTFARYGGEEFVILCPETDIDGAVILAEKIRTTIEGFDFLFGGRVTISAGVAGHAQETGASALIEKADGALYVAKKGGRNRVEVIEKPGNPGSSTEKQ